MSYMHRISTSELATALTVPMTSDASLRVVVGTAPINLAEDPAAAVNVPILANSYKEAVSQLGYSDDYDSYNLCEMMYYSFQVYSVAPIIFINVLDPTKHKKSYTNASLAVAKSAATIEESGLMLDTLVVKASSKTLAKDTDYVAAFNDDGYVEITLLASGAGASATTLDVSADQLDPSKVTKKDIIGGYDSTTGKDTGIEAIRSVYPKLGMVPGLLLAPGWTTDAEVAAALTAKTEDLNGLFTCEAVIDMDTTTVKKYTDLKAAKESMGVQNKHAIMLWPKIKFGSKIYNYSTVWATMTAQCDGDHGDVPYKSPSNETLSASAAVLADGTEVLLDIPQAEVVNSYGIVTAMNDNGWKSYGNNTSIYPSSTDPKDRWIACRRMMSWYRNHFILTFKQKVDEPASYRLVESVVDSENIYLNSLKASGAIAGGSIAFNESDNPVTEIMNGHIKFTTKVGFWPPAEWIEDEITFDPNLVTAALGGE